MIRANRKFECIALRIARATKQQNDDQLGQVGPAWPYWDQLSPSWSRTPCPTVLRALLTWTFTWICCPQLPYHLCKNRPHSTCFYSTGGAHAEDSRGQPDLECRKWGFKRWGFKQIRGYLRKKAFFLRFLDFPGAPPLSPHLLHPHLRQPN